MKERHGQSMKNELLRSQFEALEEPVDALRVDASRGPLTIVNLTVQRLDR